MSYDISVGDAHHNMTYNVAPMFYDHIADRGNGGGLRELDGKTGKQAAEILADAFTAINRTRHELWVSGAVGEPAFCSKYDAKNGWGSAVGGIVFLGEVMASCMRNPRSKVRLS